MSILMNVTPALSQALKRNNLTPEQYVPAYGGESAGLDLFNAGPDIVVPPLDSPALRKWLRHNPSKQGLDALTSWVDVPEEIRKNYYKVLIPTGLRIALRPNQVGILKERSSVTKSPLTIRAGVIDSGYTDQIYINTVNLSPFPYVLRAGDKTPFQLVVQLCDNEYAPMSNEDFATAISNAQRQDGKIGSSD